MAASLPEAVIAAGPDGTVRYMNAAAERMWGRSFEEMRGRNVNEFSAPEERARSDAIVAQLARGEFIDERFLMDMQRDNGERFTAEVTVSPLLEDGKVIGIGAVGRDVTGRVRWERDTARLQAIVAAANEAIFGVGPNGEVQFFSPSAERVFGWRADEVLGRPATNLVTPEHRMGHERLLAALERRGSLQREVNALRKDGSVLEVEMSTAPIRDPDGRVVGAAVTVLDVSERRRTQRRLERIVENAPVAVGVKDLDGRYVLFNRRAAAHIGLDLDAIIGHTDLEAFGPEAGQGMVEQDRIVIATGEPRTFRMDFTGPNGVPRSFLATTFPVPGPTGEIDGLGVIAADITELRRAAAAQAQLAAIVQAAPDAIITRDLEGRVVTWNPGAEGMFGLPAEQAIGRLYTELVVPDDQRESSLTLEAAAQSGTPAAVRVERCRADGSRFPAQVSVAPLTLDDGDQHGTLAIIRDISDLVATEHALEQRAAQLERSNTELERFAYAASHDLQEPLQSIKLSAGTVLATAADRLDEDEQELMTHIDAAASRLSGQIRGLMQIARVALSTGPAEHVPVAQTIRDAVDALRAAALNAEAELRVAEPVPDVRVPRTEVSLVLQNVIANALKYRRPDVRPRVDVITTVDGGFVWIRVADNGVGLAEQDIERVFGLFSRGPVRAEGTGIGLAVARRMLERLGGALEATSPGPGRGAVFSLRVPVAR